MISTACWRFRGSSASTFNIAGPSARASPPLRDKARDELAVLQALQAAGAPYVRVVFTQNRRILASTGRGGTLRLHQAFALAPDDILHAVAVCLGSRTRAGRAAAGRRLRDFFRQAVPPAPVTARVRRILPEHLPHLARLVAEFARVNRDFFADALPAVPLFLSGRMRRRNGHFVVDPPQIVIAGRLCTHALPGEAERTLRHEMIHLWQHASGQRVGHGRDFRVWAVRLEIVPRATREVCWREGC